MAKCEKCLIREKIRLSNEPCCCAWFMSNVICAGNRTVNDCTMYTELKKCKAVKNLTITDEKFTNNTIYLESSIYQYNINEDKYRVYSNDTLEVYIDFSKESFKECFFDMDN